MDPKPWLPLFFSFFVDYAKVRASVLGFGFILKITLPFFFGLASLLIFSVNAVPHCMYICPH